jgi:hypothetical protein
LTAKSIARTVRLRIVSPHSPPHLAGHALEAQFTPVNLLVPGSDEWFEFWGDKLDRLMDGEAPARVGRIPSEVIDLMRECEPGEVP